MSERFEEASLGSQFDPGDDGEIFDFEAASNGGLRGQSGTYSARRTSVGDGEFSDVSSEDNDGLLYDSTPSFGGGSEQEEAGEEEDVAMTGEQVQSWKIDHSSGDHKLRRKLEWPSKYILMLIVPSY
jgi:hypothetical protein